jgi:hypothetical protein
LREERNPMEASRKPLAKVEGRRRMPLSGLTIAWRGTPSLDDWVAYIVRTKSKKFILADHASEQKVKALLSRLKTMSKKEVEQRHHIGREREVVDNHRGRRDRWRADRNPARNRAGSSDSLIILVSQSGSP